MKRVAFTTLGCKANYSDTEQMIATCRRAGLEVVPFDNKAHVYVVNTCTVTAVADQQSRQLLRRARRRAPEALVIATGCAGGVDSHALGEVPEVDRVFGTSDRNAALTFLFEKLGVVVPGPAFRVPGPGCRQSRARAFLKIQDGCNRRCAYCIVPRARGRARSMPPDEIERACLALAHYHREIVLTGIDIGQYAFPYPGSRVSGLVDLLERLVNVEGLPRLRISTISPKRVDKRLVGLIATSGKVCRHIHLSIQSGSDSVLRRMGRGYRVSDITHAVHALVDCIPGIAITGDVIAGFPGERDDDHEQTAVLLSSLPIAGLHVFPYSERPKTRAATMPDQVPQRIRRGRAEHLRGIAFHKRKQYLSNLVGEKLDVIVTSSAPENGDCVMAFSDNAVSVSVPAGVVACGGMGTVIVTEVADLKVKGRWDLQKKTKTS